MTNRMLEITRALQDRARVLVEQATQMAYHSSRVFVELGFTTWELSAVVEYVTDDGEIVTGPLWRMLTDETSFLRWFSDQVNLPESSISAARSIVEFYHAELGWSQELMVHMQRGRLSAAMNWLKMTHEAQMLDGLLVAKMMDYATVAEIRDYVTVARQEFGKASSSPSTPQMGPVASPPRVLPSERVIPAMERGDPDPAHLPAANGNLDTSYVASVAAATPPEIHYQLSVNGGEYLPDVIRRVVLTALPGDLQEDAEIREAVHDAVADHFGSYMAHPLHLWEDQVPKLVGLILLQESDEIDTATLLRVQAGLRGLWKWSE